MADLNSTLVRGNLTVTDDISEGGTKLSQKYIFGTVIAPAYSDSTSYSKGKLVSYLGKLYKYINSSSSSGNLPTNTTYWSEITVADTFVDLDSSQGINAYKTFNGGLGVNGIVCWGSSSFSASVSIPASSGLSVYKLNPYGIITSSTSDNYGLIIPSTTGWTANKTISTLDDIYEEITWSALKTLRDNSQLIKGKQYRITDYQCTTLQSNTSSAGHQFDIIVVADSTNKLNENARAALHSGDTYFSNCKLEAWELKYCLDNDASRFVWADAYGIVISDTLYCRNPAGDDTTKTYGYAWSKGGTNRYTDTDNPTTETKAHSSQTGGIQYNISSIHEEQGKGVIYRMIDEFNNECPYDFKNILFTGSSYDGSISYENSYTFNYIESSTSKDASLLGFDKSCYNNIMENYVLSKKQSLNFNVFYSNSSNFNCYDNRFGYDCYSNTFKTNCYFNTFGDNVYSNTFDTYISNVKTGNKVFRNIIGVSGNTIIFGNNCSNNIFGSSCINNSFGNNCTSNEFGNNCSSNIFGNSCISNKFGNNFSNNTFGNNVSTTTFGDSSSTTDYCKYNIIDNGCQYLYINGNGTASSSNQLQNIHIHSGVKGSSSSNRRTITVDRNLAYSTDIYANGSKEIILDD